MPKIVVRYAIREIMGTAMAGAALLWPAGRIDWWPAWALVAVMLAWSTATAVVILRTNPDLLAERLGPRKGAKPWDTAIMSVVGLTTLARLVIAGFDERYGWSGSTIPPTAQVTALAVSMLANAMVVWATASNAFFSQIVRVQSERGHAVATAGPYRLVRHPAYVGSILFELAVPVLLTSWWALVPGVLNAVLFVVRTTLEDRTLHAELDGYAEYAARVRHRLVPGIW
jgi:protein-S-isoprenylcysteine O-methyltransferase Ste14